MNDKSGKFQCRNIYFVLLIGTSNVIQAIIYQLLPNHGNSNDDGTVTTHSVAVDDPPLDDDGMFNDPFAIPRSPDLASLSSSSSVDENIDKQAVLPVYPKHVRTRGDVSFSVVTS